MEKVLIVALLGFAAYGIAVHNPRVNVDEIVNAAIDNRLACNRAKVNGSHMAGSICQWADDFQREADKYIDETDNPITLRNYGTLQQL